MIPVGINRDHVLTALSRIDGDGVPPGRGNRSVELRHDGKGGGVGQVVEKHLASGFDERAIDYAVAMRPPLASYYWQGPAIRPDGVA